MMRERRMLRSRAILVVLLISLGLGATGRTVPPSLAAPDVMTPLASAQPTPTQRPTATPTPPVGERPDSCESNNDREQACQVTSDAVNGPYTFLPPGDQDYYRLDLGAPNGLQTTITVRSSGALD